jgi:acylphosphatase
VKTPPLDDATATLLLIQGRVQGVWYRASTVEKAQELGLVGWVRNRPDGSVEVLAQGKRRAVTSLEDWCRRGPTGARVDSVSVQEHPPEATNEFRIRP